MRFDLIPKHRAKLANVKVEALKMGQTELKPAVTLRFKLTAANTILNKLDKTLRPFFYEKAGSPAKGQPTLDGVEPVSDLPQLTMAATKLGAFGWDDEQTGCTLKIYQGVTGDGDITLKEVTVNKVTVEPKEGGGVDISFDAYATDLDAETMGELAVLHQHEVDIELVLPEPLQQSLPGKGSKETPESALAKSVKGETAKD